MINDNPKFKSPGYWATVKLLLSIARTRAVGRQKRQVELLKNKAPKKSFYAPWLGFVFAILFTGVIHGFAAIVVIMAITGANRAEAELKGKIVVSHFFREAVAEAVAKKPLESNDPIHLFLQSYKRKKTTPEESVNAVNLAVDKLFRPEASMISRQYGGSTWQIEQTLRESVRNHGSADLVNEPSWSSSFVTLAKTDRTLPALMGSITLLWWCVMMVFQGEGLDLYLQTRRHPMWEWLFSHPVSSGAIFMAEMLSPIAANPIYCSAPIFVGMLYGFAYSPMQGMIAGLLTGIPITVAAACLGKALEIGVTLRLPMRSRGSVIGIMSWIGFTTMMLWIIGATSFLKIVTPLAKLLHPLTILPWPWVGYFLGIWHGSYSFPVGIVTCWIVSALTIFFATAFSVWAARQGLSGNFGQADQVAVAVESSLAQFGKQPLYRKELLWFLRDRSAIVQTILIPFTLAGVQLFNLRGILAVAQNGWNYLCGDAILFGTYFLWILGPKSLASEGNALWIALTWPRGLESLLKAKAWLWSLISSGIVGIILLYTAWIFPADTWKIVMVGIGWFFFGQSMAEKTVTLVRVPSSSGEPEKIPRTRQWAASLGMLTFACGILTQQWQIAVMGIVYSYITAAAMWENFRARIPFLYDPWSEKLPPAPTLMHAMVSISILVEAGAVFTGIAIVATGRQNAGMMHAIVYGICAIMVSLGVTRFLAGRNVSLTDVCHWPENGNQSRPWWCGNDSISGRCRALLTGMIAGIVLALFARAYLSAAIHIPYLAEMIHKFQEQMAKFPDLRKSYFVMAVLFAPFAEEYLFRGLLFRALDREWGGWRAVIGSAAFFAIYHPPISWLPVGLLGITNALLFKKTGRITPAILLHMVYNIVVLY